ncbi:hypothetical protein ACTXT7_016044 [Hymenolepis weldensis]
MLDQGALISLAKLNQPKQLLVMLRYGICDHNIVRLTLTGAEVRQLCSPFTFSELRPIDLRLAEGLRSLLAPSTVAVWEQILFGGIERLLAGFYNIRIGLATSIHIFSQRLRDDIEIIEKYWAEWSTSELLSGPELDEYLLKCFNA